MYSSYFLYSFRREGAPPTTKLKYPRLINFCGKRALAAKNFHEKRNPLNFLHLNGSIYGTLENAIFIESPCGLVKAIYIKYAVTPGLNFNK